ncbi:hypothetical protein RDV78_08210 [Bacillota bacterium LX-D]|nr:hypothetical protein [Bacillota bacterium LX-D]
MKSIINKNTYKKIYALLEDVTPLSSDCGNLCGKLCCTSSDQDLGMYLLPGEEQMFTQREDWLIWDKQNAADYDFPNSWRGTVYFVRCTKGCPRDKRPLQCRTFPLAPHLQNGGQLLLIREPFDLPYLCPLITEKVALESPFIAGVYAAWLELIKDPLIYDLVQYDSQQRKIPLDIVSIPKD